MKRPGFLDEEFRMNHSNGESEYRFSISRDEDLIYFTRTRADENKDEMVIVPEDLEDIAKALTYISKYLKGGKK